ncbi:MAG: M23 family metallopeptidase [Bacteroidota bacterium]|nr:M23 family metallopeptidase [Bacteroidota bacterium]
MKAEKYVYNPQTLQFEKIQLSSKSILLRGFMFLSSVIVFSFIFYFFTSEYFPSPREKAYKKELTQMEYQFLMAKDHMERVEKIVNNLQNRDAKIHRVLFGMDPIDPNLWEAGVGGHDPLRDLNSLKYAPSSIKETKLLINKLERQLYLQSKSLDTLESLAKSREEQLASIPTIKPVRIDKLDKGLSLLSGYGIRLHPVHKINKFHQGIDFTAPPGTHIQATGNGTVVKVENKNSGYGRSVMINHGYGYQTLYAHMKDVKVREGQKVKKGEMIGTIGSTGLSTGPHCHYEVHFNNKPVNPIHYCMDGLSPKEYQEMVEKASQANQSFD